MRELDERGFDFARESKGRFLLQFNFWGGWHTIFKYFFANDLWLSQTEESEEERIRSIAAAIQAPSKGVLVCNPSELRVLMGRLKAYNLHPQLFACLLVGQLVEKELAEAAKKNLNCNVIPYYATMELSLLAIGCPEHPGKYHILSERAIVEVLDDKGASLAEGETGEVTVTLLDSFLMPLIRYQPGDQGRIYTKPECTCTNRSPLLEIVGRDSDVIRFSDGTTQPMRPLARFLELDPYFSRVRRIQIRQKKLDAVEVLLESAGPLDKSVMETFKRHAQQAYGSNLECSIISTEKIEREEGKKFRAFIPMSS